MNKQSTMVSISVLVALGGLNLAARAMAADSDALANYYENTWIWKNQQTNAVGRIWFNRDGRFYVFFNVGAQSKPPDANGPFQVQGRWGTYTVRTDSGSTQLCLWPGAPRTLLGAEQQHELFAESTCYRFTPHSVGEIWNENNDTQGRTYKMWLVKGR